MAFSGELAAMDAEKERMTYGVYVETKVLEGGLLNGQGVANFRV